MKIELLIKRRGRRANWQIYEEGNGLWDEGKELHLSFLESEKVEKIAIIPQKPEAKQ